jgi:hypothetical protein
MLKWASMSVEEGEGCRVRSPTRLGPRLMLERCRSNVVNSQNQLEIVDCRRESVGFVTSAGLVV